MQASPASLSDKAGLFGRLDLALVALILLLAFVSLLPYPFMESFKAAGVPVLRLVPLAFGLALLPPTLHRHISMMRQGMPLLFLGAPVLVFVGVQMLSSLGSVEPLNSLAKSAFYALTGATFFFAAGSLSKGSERGLLWTVLGLSSVVGALSVYEFFGGGVPFFHDHYLQNNPYYTDVELKGRSFSTLGHPVFLGAYFVMAMPAGFYLLETEGKVHARALAFVFLAASVLGLFFTFSRGAWLAVLVSAAVYYRGRLSGRKVAAILVLLTMVAGLAAASGMVREVLKGRNPYYDYVERFKSAHRVKAFELTARVLGDVPLLGMGVGNFRGLYERYRAPGDDTREVFATPDNMYLVTLAEVGLLGFGILMYILYRGFNGLSDAYRKKRGSAFLLAGASMLAGFAVDSFFFDSLYVEPIRVVFWTMMGLACRESMGD